MIVQQQIGKMIQKQCGRGDKAIFNCLNKKMCKCPCVAQHKADKKAKNNQTGKAVCFFAIFDLFTLNFNHYF